MSGLHFRRRAGLYRVLAGREVLYCGRSRRNAMRVLCRAMGALC